MSKKITIEYVKEFALKNGIICLSNEYNTINNHTLLQFKCSKNHIYETTWKKFKSGSRCNQCFYISRAYTIDYIKEQSKILTYECLSEYYINNKVKLTFKCPKNHIFYMDWHHFKTENQRCSECSPTKKLTIDQIIKESKIRGYTCLETEYINNKTHMRFVCPNNHLFRIRWDRFIIGQNCRFCYIKQNRGEKHHLYKSDRTRQKRSKYLSFDISKLNILIDDPNYNNYIKELGQYNIDHIYPRIAFIENNLDNIHPPHIIKQICNLRENLQIISKGDNLYKSSKYNQEEFIKWFNEKLQETNEY